MTPEINHEVYPPVVAPEAPNLLAIEEINNTPATEANIIQPEFQPDKLAKVRKIGRRAIEAVGNNKYKMIAGTLLASVALIGSTPDSQARDSNWVLDHTPCNAGPDVACDAHVPDSDLSNFEVYLCLDKMKASKSPRTGEYWPGIAGDKTIEYKVGSKKVKVESRIKGNEVWENDSLVGKRTNFWYSCAKLVDTTISQKLVRKTNNKRTKKRGFKSLTKTRTFKGPTNTEFVPSHMTTGGDFTVKRTYTLPNKLTRSDVRKRNICVKDIVTGVPLIQVPYFNPLLSPNVPTSNIPGPLAPLVQSNYLCINKSQVKNYKTKKRTSKNK